MPDAALTPRERRAVVRASLGVGIATGAYGVSFGAVAVAGGLSVVQACALSLLVFTGASQFALVGVLAAGGSLVSGGLTALLLATRNTLYGLRLAPLLRLEGWQRTASAHLVIDESSAMAFGQRSPEAARVGFFTTGTTIFVLWNLSTFAGALAGSSLGDPRRYGLDAAVGAAFLGLLWPRLRVRRNQVVAGLAAALALSTVPFVPAGMPVLVAGGVALVAGVLGRSPAGTGPG